MLSTVIVLKWIKDHYKICLIILVAILLFCSGYWTCKKFTKPVMTTVTKTVTITLAPTAQTPTTPVVNQGVVNPGTHYINTSEQPKPPTSSVVPLDKPDQTTVTTIQVPTPMKLQVFHQSELKWVRNGDAYNIWDEGRVWTLDEKGQPLEGITADTSYSKDAQLQLPVTFTTSCPSVHKWAAGGILNVHPTGFGAFLDRDVAFIRVGATITRITAPLVGPVYTEGSLKVGIIF